MIVYSIYSLVLFLLFLEADVGSYTLTLYGAWDKPLKQSITARCWKPHLFLNRLWSGYVEIHTPLTVQSDNEPNRSNAIYRCLCGLIEKAVFSTNSRKSSTAGAALIPTLPESTPRSEHNITFAITTSWPQRRSRQALRDGDWLRKCVS